MVSDNDLGARLKAYRIRRKVSQAALAGELGIRQSYYSKIETGAKHPSRRFYRLAENLLVMAPHSTDPRRSARSGPAWRATLKQLLHVGRIHPEKLDAALRIAQAALALVLEE